MIRPPAPRQSSRPGGPGSRPRRAIVGAFALALGASCVSLVVACASAPGSPPRRNRMEAPPPFPVAPDFSLPDALGAPQTLSSLMGPRGLVLVLYRGHWWPYCRAQLGELQAHLQEFAAVGVHVAAVSADDLDGAKTMVHRKGLTFPVLSDPQGALLKAYRHWDGDAGIGLAGTFVIRPDRSVAFYEDDGERFRRRPSSARVLEVARGL